MNGELAAVVVYALLTILWGLIFALYLRQRRSTRDDALIRALLAVLALDAFKSFAESVYFGLLWGANYGVFPEALRSLGNATALAVAKLLNLVVAVVVLAWLIRRWVPTELGERRARREKETKLRAQLEASLATAQESEDRFRVAATASRDAVWDWDLVRQTVFTTERFAEMLGYDPRTWRPTMKEWRSRLHPADAARVSLLAEAFIRGEADVYDVRFRMMHRDGHVLHVSSTATLKHDERGRPTRMVGVTRDLTAEVKAEETRLTAQKLEGIGLLAGGVAHDFNNLLTVVSSSIAVAARHSTSREASDALGTAATAIQRAATLTKQLLAYAGHRQLAAHLVQLNRMVEEVSELLHVSVPKQVRLKLELGADVPPVMGDEGQLQQVVMNLITNAAEAIGDRDGEVTLRTSREDVDGKNVVRFRVTDTGSGMSAEVRARIFDPFFSTKGTGRGLGLAAIAGILRAHGGSIEIDSAPGKGSTFTVTLPAESPGDAPGEPAPGAPTHGEPAAEPTSAPARRVPVTKQRRAARVLLVDDEPLVRRSTSRLLEHLGCTVTTANDGADAVALVAAGPGAFDVVIMDVTMPKMNGFEATKQIVGLAPNLPVVLSSGYSAAPADAGLSELRSLGKPYRIDELEAVLDGLTLPSSQGS